MNAHTRSWTLGVVALMALLLLAGPAAAQTEEAWLLAVEETSEEVAETGEETGEEETGRPALAETPRDRVGLLLLAALVVGGGLAIANGRRQMRGERPQASGEFRWR